MLVPARLLLLGLLLLGLVPLARAADDQWVIGRWALSYDPDGAKQDWLVFKPNGDVISIFPDGQRVLGMYIVTPRGVKAVFTYRGKDVIMTFFTDAQHRRLRIVTSHTGRASVYSKVD